MRKLTTSTTRLPSLGGVTAICSLLAVLVPVENAQGACAAGGQAATLILDRDTAHIGDTVNILELGYSSGANSCTIFDGQSFIIYPNGHTNVVLSGGNGLNGAQLYMSNFDTTTFSAVLQCPSGPSSGGSANCLPVTMSYVVNANDISNSFTFINPALGNLRGGITSGSVVGAAKTVQFLVVSAGLQTLATNQGAGGPGSLPVLIVFPGIEVTKHCVTNCPPFSSPFGQPIDFTGVITNSGDDTLTNVVVVDNPGTTITYGTSTTLGNPFPATGGGTLVAGDSVSYSGSYTPTANPCGPFTDQVIASGTESVSTAGIFTNQTVFATNTATCLVCTTPCIAVTKTCPSSIPFGTLSYIVGGTVTNCGNVPLTNVVVVDDNGTPNNPADDIIINIGVLGVNGSASYTATNTVPATCGPFTDTVVASATGQCGGNVSSTNRCTTTVTTAPCIAVTKTCPPSIPFGTLSYIVSGTVTNCGNVPLTNVVVVDDNGTPNNTADDISISLGTVGAFSSAPWQATNTVTAGFCGNITNTAAVTGFNLCTGLPVGPQTASCTTTIPCRACISVTKQIACFLGTNAAGNEVCGTFSHSATGFKVVTSASTNLPAFCYSITVSNPCPVGLTNVSIIDDQFGDLTADFSCVGGVFAPGGSCSFSFKAALAADLTNTVTASGQSVANSQRAIAQDFATGHVFQASIECTKLVTSPDDLDGNTNDSHVSFACGSGEHLVSYSVVVTNSGDADLTNIVITDPTLAAICTLPGEFALPAHQVLTIPLCNNITFDCGTGGGTTGNNCANPVLGTAVGCTVLELSSNSVSITGPPGGIQGNVCIAPNGKLSITGSEFVTGNIELGPGATFSKSGSGTIGGVVMRNVDLTSDIAAALSAASFAASLPCTQRFTQLNTTTTITGTVGTNVICIQSVVLNSATITLTGPAGAKFILDVTGKFVLNGTSHIVVAGGVQPRDVLYNIIGTGEDVAFTGGGGGATCCNSSVDGTLLAVGRKINLSPGLVNGQVISAQNISIVSGSSVRCPPGCTPVSVPNTVTINAEISASQSNTNINPACVRDINGRPITASSQCSALVECNQ